MVKAISVLLSWYPKLLEASHIQRANWKICGGGYGIHFPDIDEDLSTEGLLRGAPAPNSNQKKPTKKKRDEVKNFISKKKAQETC
jgi:hypothetical protein